MVEQSRAPGGRDQPKRRTRLPAQAAATRADPEERGLRVPAPRVPRRHGRSRSPPRCT